MIRKPLYVLAMGASLVATVSAAEHAKKVSTTSTVVDGKSYKVIRYDDDTVKVVEGGMFGKVPGLALRAAMRRAVKQATECSIKDDFFVDAKLNGVLSCLNVSRPTGSI